MTERTASLFSLNTYEVTRAGNENGVRPTMNATVAVDEHAELNRRLDSALEETFPASDPVAILISH